MNMNNLKYKLFLGLGAIVGTSSIFTGCAITNGSQPQETNQQRNIVLNSTINLNTSKISSNDISNYKKILENLYKQINKKELSKFSKTITEEDVMSLTKNLINDSNLFSNDCKKYLINNYDNPLALTFKDTIINQGDKLWSITLSGIGYDTTTNKDDTNKFLIADMNFVSDNPGFKIQPLKLTLDKSNKIIKVERFGELIKSANTRKPLDTYSNINDDLNSDFKANLNTLLKKLQNKSAYDNLIQHPNNTSNVESIISTVRLDNSKDVLIELFKALNDCPNGGYGITEYIHTDFGANSESKYILSIPSGNKIQKFSINYNRITDKITGIIMEK